MIPPGNAGKRAYPIETMFMLNELISFDIILLLGNGKEDCRRFALKTCRMEVYMFPWETLTPEVHYVQLPEPLYSLTPGDDIHSDDFQQHFNSNILRFAYSSFLQPPIVYDYDMDNRRKRKVSEAHVSEFIKDQYHQKRIYATQDNHTIPISLVYKLSMKNSSGGNPLLLYAYGAYGTMTKPVFSPELLSLLDRGVIYAIAHVRGYHGDLGWHCQVMGRWERTGIMMQGCWERRTPSMTLSLVRNISLLKNTQLLRNLPYMEKVQEGCW